MFSLVPVVLVLVLPVSACAHRTTGVANVPASAQSKPSNKKETLIGSWALPDAKDLGFTFRADSTLTGATQIPQGKTAFTGRWRLASDTLVVSGVKATINGKTAQMTVVRRTLSLQEKQLTLTRIDDHKSLVYERVDSLMSPKP